MNKKKFNLQEEIEKIIKKFNINDSWNKNILKDVKKFEENRFNKASYKRKNLKELDFVTIDGEDAKDFDDAVFCKKNSEDLKLYVAIADVSHYVEINSSIDKEAKKGAHLLTFRVMLCQCCLKYYQIIYVHLDLTKISM